MIRPALASLILAAAAALAGCGNDPSVSDLGLGALAPDIRTAVQARGASRAATAATPAQPTGRFPGLDPAVTAGFSDPLLGAYIGSRGATAGLTVLGRTGDQVVWRTADNVALTLTDRGMLVQTRGLGADLHIADVRQTEALIAAGTGGTATRRQMYLDGVYATDELRLTCQITPAGAETLALNGRQVATQRFDERCEGAAQPVTNSYWRAAQSGRVVQSIQWAGADIGSIHLQRLND